MSPKRPFSFLVSQLIERSSWSAATMNLTSRSWISFFLFFFFRPEIGKANLIVYLCDGLTKIEIQYYVLP